VASHAHRAALTAAGCRLALSATALTILWVSKFSLELKTETVRRHDEDGVSVRRLAEEIGAAESTVRRWVQSTRSHGGPAAASRHASDCMCIRCWRLARC
jgi:transposase-like protein